MWGESTRTRTGSTGLVTRAGRIRNTIIRDLARTQQKGGGGLVHQSILTFLAFHCNHIKLNSPKKGGGRRGAE